MRHNGLRLVLIVGLVTATFVMGGTVYGILVLRKVQQNTSHIDRLQRNTARRSALDLLAVRRALVVARRTDYRLCQRQNVVRAALQLVAGLNPQLHLLPGLSSHYVPLLNCSPNLRGEEAVVLDARSADAYLRAFALSRVDPVTGLAW